MKATTTAQKISPLRLWAVFATAIALVFVPRATPANTPILNLGPITVANGTAVLTGSVGSEALSDQLTINGQAIGVDAAGNFAAVVNLAGASSVGLTLSDPAGNQQTGFTIPLTLAGPTGIIPGGVLDTIEQAGLKLLEPVTNGEAVTVGGAVADKSQLAGLTVNGRDVLGALGPDGSFSIEVPGTTKTVTLSATDTHGVQENVVNSVHTPLSATSVAATQAVGITIASVRYVKKGVLRTHRVRMVVTVKDRQGRLVKGAKIFVYGATKARRLAKRPKASLSGTKGTATVLLRLRSAAFGKRLSTITIAKTPSAKAQKKSSVSVPRLKHKRSHR
jgi:hypothetical protein